MLHVNLGPFTVRLLPEAAEVLYATLGDAIQRCELASRAELH
jgi:hypothetical protein